MIDTLKEILRNVLPDRTLRLYLFLLFSQIAFYTTLIHYAMPILENQHISWLEAMLFVLETMTTVGYGNLLPFTNQITVGLVILIMATGVFTVLMIIPVLLTPYLTSMLKATPPQKLFEELEGHVVIIGFGELTRELIASLMISNLPILIVEEDETVARHIRRSYQREIKVIWGEYGNPSTWNNAQVKSASNVIISADERTTATIILGIREKTEARIIAVVDDLSFGRYLRYAGAEHVLSPKNSTGKILARHAVLRPEADTIYEAITPYKGNTGPEARDISLKLIKAPIMEGCRNIGKSLGELDFLNTYGVDVLFFLKEGEFVLHPKDEDIIDSSTVLFLLGKANALSEVLERELKSEYDGDMAVIAGYGDVGKSAYQELTESGINCVVVDPKTHDVNAVRGNAEYESVLEEVHIEDARFLIVAVNDDNVNIFTTLMARNMNPTIRILARANDPSSIDKLYRAGADYVALLPIIGGQVIAGIVLADIVQVLLDLPNGQKAVMKHNMRAAPTTIGWLERKSGVRVLGVEGSVQSTIHPSPEEPLIEGDAVIAVGGISEIKRFIRLLVK